MTKLVLINDCFAPVKPQNLGVLFVTEIFAHTSFLLVDSSYVMCPYNVNQIPQYRSPAKKY
jgi:hypothetical protein